MRLRFVFITLFLLFISHLSTAQQFGGNSPSTKWQQINTDTVRVVFPKGFEQNAQRVANITHQLQKNYSISIGNQIRKVTIVLQNQGLISNGYVGLGPYRSEFYTTPLQNGFELGAINPVENLAVHEFRHVQQYSNFRKGLSKVASFILGQEGQAIANAASVPDWFFEGDAVFNETKLTRQGRGTLPLFLSSYQSLYNSGYHYTYMKMRNGSLRDYVPDHYDLGYLLVAYGNKQYGSDIWRKVTDDAARFKPLLYPFQGALKKHTGIAFSEFVQNAMAYYQEQWDTVKTAAPDWLTAAEKHNVLSYRYPYATTDGSLIVLKRSYRKVPAFYRVYQNKNEEKIAVKDVSVDDYFSYNNGRIIYAAYRPDVRWGNKDNAALKVINVFTGEEKQVGPPRRYLSPDISQDGTRLVSVIANEITGSSLMVMDAQGRALSEIAGSEEVFTYPKFSKDGRSIYTAVRKRKGESAIVRYSLDGGVATAIIPFTNRIIGFLQVQGDTLLYSTTYKGRDELWAYIDTPEKSGNFRLATYSTGLYQGTMLGTQLVGSAFTANGYRLAGFKPLWERVEQKDELRTLYVDQVFKPADHQVLDSLPSRIFSTAKYPKATNLLNFHSWRPYYDYPEYSFTVYGENVLNTFRTELAYTYNQNEGSHKLGFNSVYGGTYLQPVFGVNQTWDRSARARISATQDTAVQWNELAFYAGLRLPLNLTSGKRYRYLTLQGTYNAEQVRWTGPAQKIFRNADFNYLEGLLQFGSQVQQAVQHINPRWAQTLLVRYRNSINNYTANQLLVSGSLYLPGIGINHSLVLTAAYQQRDTMQQYQFGNSFPFSRGYRAVDFPKMWKMGANYHFPVAYPDWGFGNIVYFRRIRANAFYDYTEGKSLRTGARYQFATAGGELFFDTRWWNQENVTFGVRYSHLLNNEFSGVTKPGIWEFILPVKLF